MIKYKIIEEKGKVKAFLYDTEKDVYNKIAKEFRKILNQSDLRLLHKSYTAQATSCPEDAFNEDIGKRIAKDRLLVKYYNDRVETGIKVAEFYEKYLVEIYKMIRHDFNKRADYIRDLEDMGIEV